MQATAIELRPDSDIEELSAEFLTGDGGAMLIANGGRIEKRKASPAPGWYAFDPKRGASGPFSDPRQARRSLRP